MPLYFAPANLLIAQHPMTELDKHWLIAYYIIFVLLLSVFVIYKRSKVIGESNGQARHDRLESGSKGKLFGDQDLGSPPQFKESYLEQFEHRLESDWKGE